MKKITRTLWRAKASVLACVVVATVFGASTAVAGSGVGAVFNLGYTNLVDAQSTLRGTTNNAMLRVVNTNSGTSAKGLSIYTATSKPPIVVENPNSGTATNLSADKLDGKNSSDFLGATQKATDSDKLDGRDSSVFAHKCQDEGGAVRGFAHVRAAADFPSTMTPLEWYDADSCGGQGVLAKRKAQGEYYVQFPGANTYYASVGSTEVVGTFLSVANLNTEDGVAYVVRTQDHNGTAVDAPFTLAVF